MKRTRTSLLVAGVFALFVGACGGSSAPSPTGVAPTAVPATPTAAPATPTTAPATPTKAPPFTVTKDIVFMAVDGTQYQTNVYQPAGDGPWPVVVSFHGFDPMGRNAPTTDVVARAAATAGMVVFTPTWITSRQLPVTVETMETWDAIVSCAVAFAQEMAVQYRGDPATTIVGGFSAGAGGALLFASAKPRTDPVPGCVTDALPGPVKGFVLGDGEYLLNTDTFDGVFSTDPAWMEARYARMLAPTSWAVKRKTRFFLWVAAEGWNPRTIGDPSTGWFAQRDPDGSLQADLERIGGFADGVVTYADAGGLLALRLADAGFDVTLDEYPGGHTTLNKVSELVGYFQAISTPPGS